MKFAILGHAALHVEHRGLSLLMDPWLVGSCYWRSWWNYPELDPSLLERLEPDFIYITHLHWDHFHGPSLRRFDRRTKILVPRVHTTRMMDDLKGLGFENVTEVPHASSIELGQGLVLHSYQFGIGTDSAVLLTDGRTTLFNANDCKLFGYPLRRILRRFPAIDFVFRSYSSASAIPYCIEGYQEKYASFRRPEDYVEEFGRFAMHVGAKYAVPFASNHCFLHRDTIHFNDTSVSPNDVERSMMASVRGAGCSTACVVMPPGSSWSDESGFAIRSFDYSRKGADVEAMRLKHAEKLEECYRVEDRTKADFIAFERYLRGALDAMPRWLPFVRSFRVTFQVKDVSGERHWLVNFGRKEVKEIGAPDPGSLVVEIHAAVLNDCTRKRMFSTLGPSKRLRFRLADGGTWFDVRLVLSLLELYELDLLPFRRHFSRRHLGIWLRRWPELVELVGVVVRHKLLRRPFRIASLYPVRRAPKGIAGQ